MKVFLEYIWLDGYKPTNLRSKTKVIDDQQFRTHFANNLPTWSFDGSSTKQAEGTKSDCLLKPVYVCDDPFRGKPHKLVLCKVQNPDGSTHESNTRDDLHKLIEMSNMAEQEVSRDYRGKDNLPWFGWEQEYTLMWKPQESRFKEGEGFPFGYDPDNKPREQGEYYCGVGNRNVIGREIAEEHLVKCVDIGLDVSGVNAEVLIGQWEYQIGPVTALNGSDQLWMSRYILNRVAEDHGVGISYHPKPIKGDWNGSGCHVNFSTKEMRDEGGKEHIESMCEVMGDFKDEQLESYGDYNDQRLTGDHETSNLNEYTWGYSDRGRSIRIPISVQLEGKGYLEDRRPSSNCDPYKVANMMIKISQHSHQTINQI
jgi:glutamine synthetase